jgi:photosystem II PsbJ protein
LFEEVKAVSGSGRIPLWIVATIAGIGVLTVVGIFFYGAYAGLGSAM